MWFVLDVCYQYGLYCAFIGSFTYVIFGSAKDICLGTSAIMSFLSSQFAPALVANDATPAIMMTFFCGFVYLAIFLFNLGKYNECIGILSAVLELSYNP